MTNFYLTPMRCLGIFVCLLFANLLNAQSQSPLDIALRHIEQNHKTWNLSKEDVADMSVSSSHISSISGAAHIYFQQRYQGIDIYNAILNVSISNEGKVLSTGKRFIPQVASKVNSTQPLISAEEALIATLNHLEKTIPASFSVKEERENVLVFDKGNFAHNDVEVKLSYFQNEEGTLILSYGMYINPSDDIEMWQIHVDAATAKVIHQQSLLIQCRHLKNLSHRHNSQCNDQVVAKANFTEVKEALAQTNTTSLANSYRVFKLPTESPIHGPHVIVSNPEDLSASPLGWHDTGNVQYTITRGNNGHAFLDRDDDSTPDIPEPDGGVTLDFDFPFALDSEADEIQGAAQVNLFYLGNMMHDFAYSYGFDEAAGNFQVNNFGNGGLGNDGVTMRAQAGADNGSLNNATMGTPNDGNSPTLSMFVWNNNLGTGLLTVTAPEDIEGIYNTGSANFGPEVTDVPICGEVVIVDDGINDPSATDGCELPFINGEDLEGKVALIDRGGCFFQDKALHAQENGAIAVIVCNFEDAIITMGAGGTGSDPQIPTLMISKPDCDTIRQFANGQLEVCFVTPPDVGGPEFVDGDLDNGIIAHEFAHGISNRLTGGGNNSVCLSNAEQMGEGWSDWATLVTTVKEGDTGEMARGIGNYAVRLEADGVGIRNYPYSTDMNVNPLTYSNIVSNPEAHDLGEVWTAMIWDLYWAMVDVYGWSPDLNHGTMGNNMAIALVMEGMKMQPCSPGFVSGRDAILAADEALYGGANQCLIWEVFARRGLGFYAEENDTNNTGDGVESFEPMPTCIEELKIKKEVTPLINAGEVIDVSVTVTNHKPEPATLTNVTVVDELVDGLTYIEGSASANVAEVNVNGNMLSLTLGDMDYLDEMTITYQLGTSSDIFSTQIEFDDVEYDTDGALDWWEQVNITGANNFALWDENAYAGEQCWFIPDAEGETQAQLVSTKDYTIQGNRPVFRFYSAYNTEAGADGGLFEVSSDDGDTYQQVGDYMVRNGYPAGIQYGTFVVPFLDAFSGDSEGYQATYVDMSNFMGETLKLRFHFATDDNTNVGGGWWIDNFEFMDMKNYNTTTCVTSDQGDNACTTAAAEGTIVESQAVQSSVSSPDASVEMGVFPNPAKDRLSISIASEYAQEVGISLFTIDGRSVRNMVLHTSIQTETVSFDVADLPAGFYLVKATATDGVLVEKVVIE